LAGPLGRWRRSSGGWGMGGEFGGEAAGQLQKSWWSVGSIGFRKIKEEG